MSMELIGYDVTLKPTGLHQITLECIGDEYALETIRKVYNTGNLYGIGLTRSCAKKQMKNYILGTNNEKENKTMTATDLCRIEANAYEKGYSRGMVETKARYGFSWNNKDLKIKKVIFNDPATIVFWADGTKTVAKAHGDDKFDKEVGLTVCIAKKAMGNKKKKWDQVFKKWIK